MCKLKRGLVVSLPETEACSLSVQTLLHFAKSACEGGAVALTVEGAESVKIIKSRVSLPVIGYIKSGYRDNFSPITRNLSEAATLVEAGTDVVLIDSFSGLSAGGTDIPGLIKYVKTASRAETAVLCRSKKDAALAVYSGADYLFAVHALGEKATTADNLCFFRSLTALFPDSAVIACLSVWNTDALKAVCATGVYSVATGSAIVRPELITQRFCKELKLC